MWANFLRIIEFFYPKNWVWDPGSGKNLFGILDPGVKKAPDPGSATLIFIIYLTYLSRGNSSYSCRHICCGRWVILRVLTIKLAKKTRRRVWRGGGIKDGHIEEGWRRGKDDRKQSTLAHCILLYDSSWMSLWNPTFSTDAAERNANNWKSFELRTNVLSTVFCTFTPLAVWRFLYM